MVPLGSRRIFGEFLSERRRTAALFFRYAVKWLSCVSQSRRQSYDARMGEGDRDFSADRTVLMSNRTIRMVSDRCITKAMCCAFAMAEAMDHSEMKDCDE